MGEKGPSSMGVIKQKLLKRDSRHNNGEHRLMLRDEENETATKAVIVVMGTVTGDPSSY